MVCLLRVNTAAAKLASFWANPITIPLLRAVAFWTGAWTMTLDDPAISTSLTRNQVYTMPVLRFSRHWGRVDLGARRAAAGAVHARFAAGRQCHRLDRICGPRMIAGYLRGAVSTAASSGLPGPVLDGGNERCFTTRAIDHDVGTPPRCAAGCLLLCPPASLSNERMPVRQSRRRVREGWAGRRCAI